MKLLALAFALFAVACSTKSAEPAALPPQSMELSKSTEATESVSSILMQARCVPHFIEGVEPRQPDGFQCFQIDPTSLYYKIGVRDNDVLLEADELVLDKLDVVMTFIERLRRHELRKLKLRRLGKILILSPTYR